ncbi:hypothetical protein HW115_11410 [Verrucomicrobiaceae bacterium N1E253]|uniref:CHASE2 domain-containing protein n=1 Tax=Oceaniferula marina TaxID=2748318 RepID=A0A851GN10_9BACT|nr:hypothetical protein [Oceaniferula marina]NWK56220.1 hypothetical protein [Oceaniferula marina]
MKLSTVTARFIIALITMGMGTAMLLIAYFAPFSSGPSNALNSLDARCIKAIFSASTRVTDYHPDERSISVRALGIHPEQSKPIQRLLITDDPERIFESSPPSPLDYAVMLEHLHDRGYRHVLLATHMSWDREQDYEDAKDDGLEGFDENLLSIHALNTKLALFEQSAIGFPVTRGAQDQTIPEPLKRSLIPYAQVSGNHQLIPMVNQVPLPSQVQGGPHTLGGFNRIESSPSSSDTTPLLAHWSQDGLIPSLALLAIMQAHNVPPEELHIDCGKRIILGHDGPHIPIDEYGQTPAPDPGSSALGRKPAPATIAHELITTREKDQGSNKLEQSTASAMVLIMAKGAIASQINLYDEEHLAQLPILCETLPTPGEDTCYQRLPFSLELALIVGLSLILCRYLTLSPYYRHLAFTLTIALLMIAVLILVETRHQWFGLSAPLTALLTAWLTSSQIKKTETTE